MLALRNRLRLKGQVGVQGKNANAVVKNVDVGEL